MFLVIRTKGGVYQEIDLQSQSMISMVSNRWISGFGKYIIRIVSIFRVASFPALGALVRVSSLSNYLSCWW